MMILIDNKVNCTGCHACYNICPNHCISMVSDKSGFLYPSVDSSTCINCNLCVKACPIAQSNTKNIDALQIGYAAYSRNQEIRQNSSSGGIFSQIAYAILAEGGIVVGAAMQNSNWIVHHVVIESEKDLSHLQGSKYTQSEIGDTLRRTQVALDQGKKVLFTGTPCQISALYSFLGRKYENLYTQDIICHGVPSPKVFREYVNYQEKDHQSKVETIQFRNKNNSWKEYEVVIQFENRNIYRQKFFNDSFMNGFLHDVYLRPSCYDCQFKTMERQSDITLADFWGIQNVLPIMDDDQGTSFVWIHTAKGQMLFDRIKNDIVYHRVECERALNYNPSATVSSKQHSCSEKILQELHHKNFTTVVAKYTRPSLKHRISNIARKIKRRLK